MTQEEKAKAYDMALERASKIKNGEDNWRFCDLTEISPALEEVFPELAESDDERIMKELIEAFEAFDEEVKKWNKELDGLCKEHYGQKSSVWDNPIMTNEMLMEKQKESLHIPESCKENTDSFTNEQKEQKPDIELIQRSWYMEGYHDREFGKEPKWILKTGEGGPKHELNPRYGQSLAGQQPTEEQMHNLNEVIKTLRMDGFDRLANSLHSLYIFLKSTYHQLTQEQKPVDPSDDELQRHQDELYDFKVFAAKQAKEHHISFVHDFEWNNFCEGILSYFNEQKPASISCGHENDTEWSEEDEEIFNNIIEKAKGGHWIEVNEITWLINRFKSLRPSWKPSEEQMSMLLAVLNDPNNAGSESCHLALKSIYEQLKKL